MMHDGVLGSIVKEPIEKLEIVPISDHTKIDEITFVTNEVTSLCPVTNQPDLSKVEILYKPSDTGIIESKSLKLFLWNFRNRGIFCEDMAIEIATRISIDARCNATVTVTQQPRGGIATSAKSTVLFKD